MKTHKDNSSEDFEKIADYLANESSDKERSSLEAWLSEKEANRRLFDKVKKVWQASEICADDFCPNVELAWEKLKKAKDKARQMPVKDEKIGADNKKWIPYAASVALLLSALVGWLAMKETHFVQKMSFQQETVEANKKGQVELADGSKVWLNSNTRFYYPKAFDDKRVVYLEGEAYFEIARDEERPFVIYSGQSVTEVLGTSFNVNTKDNTVTVTVASGRVALYPEGNKESHVVLEKGEAGRFMVENKVVSKVKNEDINYLSWQTGVLTFEGASLSAVAKALSRHYGAEVAVDGEAPESCRLTCSFKNQTLDEVLELIRLTLDIEIKKEKERILLVGKNC